MVLCTIAQDAEKVRGIFYTLSNGMGLYDPYNEFKGLLYFQK